MKGSLNQSNKVSTLFRSNLFDFSSGLAGLLELELGVDGCDDCCLLAELDVSVLDEPVDVRDAVNSCLAALPVLPTELVADFFQVHRAVRRWLVQIVV